MLPGSSQDLENIIYHPDCIGKANFYNTKMELKKNNFNHSIVSVFSFFTNGFQIFSGIHVGLFSGAFTCSRHPLNTCTFFVPRSRSRIVTGFCFVPSLRFAAFNAACLGCFPSKRPCSVPSSSCKTKFLLSAMVSPVAD